MGFGRGGDHIAQARLAAEMAQGITDAMQGRDRAADNRARLLRDLRSDPASPAFAKAARHLARSIVDRVESGPAAEYAALQAALRKHVETLPAAEQAALATFGLMAGVMAVEQDQTDAAKAAPAKPARIRRGPNWKRPSLDVDCFLGSEDAGADSQMCINCGNHIDDHFGDTEYRCEPAEPARSVSIACHCAPCHRPHPPTSGAADA